MWKFAVALWPACCGQQRQHLSSFLGLCILSWTCNARLLPSGPVGVRFILTVLGAVSAQPKRRCPGTSKIMWASSRRALDKTPSLAHPFLESVGQL